jgi:outer membrane protein assembly factor BamB
MRLDLATGKTVWKVNAPDTFSMPVLTPELAIVAGSGYGTDEEWTSVRAYDRATGEPRWHHRVPGVGNTIAAPHLQHGVVYFASYDGHAAALDAATGTSLWERVLDVDCCGVHGVAISDDVMLLSIATGLVALSTADGHELWRYELPNFELANTRPVLVDHVALLLDLGGKLHAFDARTGALQWEMQTPWGDTARSMAPMATDGHHVFVLTGVVHPALSAINLTTGNVRWTQRPGAWSYSMVASNGVLYVANAHQVLTFDANTGATLPIALLKSNRYAGLSLAQGHLLLSGGPVRAAEPASTRPRCPPARPSPAHRSSRSWRERGRSGRHRRRSSGSPCHQADP